MGWRKIHTTWKVIITQFHHVVQFQGDNFLAYKEELIGEGPLLIHIEGRPYSVVMRTPGE